LLRKVWGLNPGIMIAGLREIARALDAEHGILPASETEGTSAQSREGEDN